MRKAVLLLGCCVLLGLTACGGNEEKVIPNTQGQTGEQGNVNSGNNEENTKVNGYVFKYKNTDIEMDKDITGYLKNLGEPTDYSEAPSCAFDNLDKFYTYPGIEISTYYLDGKDLVLSVILFDDTVSTAEGVSIGDAKTKVAQVYGTATESTDTAAIYKKDNMKLVFFFEGDMVKSIQYNSLVLD